MKFCVVANNYPTERRFVHIFLDNLVREFVDLGHTVDVVAPQSVFCFLFKKDERRKRTYCRLSAQGRKYNVYSPLYWIYPSCLVGKIRGERWTTNSYYRALKRVYNRRNFSSDLFYGHFFRRSGESAVRLARELGKPSFIANGEADTIASLCNVQPASLRRTMESVTGVIAVSSKNKGEVEQLCDGNQTIMNKVVVVPNAVDETRFFNKNRMETRKKLGFPLEAFVVAFTGSFIERKGIGIISKVLSRMDDAYSIFIGRGELKPTCKNVLFCGRLPNEQMVDYLNAADVFVLPTLAEGCSNAIIEALSCGLPVISSNREFNLDVLDDSCSVLVDPLNEEEIFEAIEKIKENLVFRAKLSEGALSRAKSLTIKERARKILSFINERF